MSDNVIYAQFGKPKQGVKTTLHQIDTSDEALGIFDDFFKSKWPLGELMAVAFNYKLKNAPSQIWNVIRGSYDPRTFRGELMSNYTALIPGKEGVWHVALVIEPIEGLPENQKPGWRAEHYGGLENYLSRLGASYEMRKGVDPWTDVLTTLIMVGTEAGYVITKPFEEGDSIVWNIRRKDDDKLWYRLVYTLNGAAKDFAEFTAWEGKP